jgi:hypothetical protein
MNNLKALEVGVSGLESLESLSWLAEKTCKEVWRDWRRDLELDLEEEVLGNVTQSTGTLVEKLLLVARAEVVLGAAGAKFRWKKAWGGSRRRRI